MTPDEIKAQIKRSVSEPTSLPIYDTAIDEAVLNGVALLGLEIKQVAPSFFNKRKSLSSNTHVFPWPVDCSSILNVRDLRANAKDITGATNASPIVVTSSSHGYSDDDIIVVHDITGNTAANGTWRVVNKAINTLELYGSGGNADYVSGGKMFKESSDFGWVTRKEPSEIGLDNSAEWYPRGRNIVIGKYDFEDDLLIEYVARPETSDDIPCEYHAGIIAYSVISLSNILPAETFRERVVAYHSNILELMLHQIRVGIAASVAPEPICFLPEED